MGEDTSFDAYYHSIQKMSLFIYLLLVHTLAYIHYFFFFVHFFRTSTYHTHMMMVPTCRRTVGPWFSASTVVRL